MGFLLYVCLHSLYAQVTVNILKYKNKLKNTFQRYDPIKKLRLNSNKIEMLLQCYTIEYMVYVQTFIIKCSFYKVQGSKNWFFEVKKSINPTFYTFHCAFLKECNMALFLRQMFECIKKSTRFRC